MMRDLNIYEVSVVNIEALVMQIDTVRVDLNIHHTEIYRELGVSQQTYLAYKRKQFLCLSIEQLIQIYGLFARVEREKRAINKGIANHHKNQSVRVFN
jgi:hypothetical protein